MDLLLIRHGQTHLHKEDTMVGWTNDPGLDVEGQLQVKKLAEHIRQSLANFHFEVIYTSPLPRAKQTAEILGAILDIPLLVDDTLKDINMGDWAGQSVAAVGTSDIGRRYFLDPVGIRLPNGEEIADVLKRVIPTVECIRRKVLNSSAILVSHLEVIKLVTAYYTHHDLHNLHSLGKIPTASGRMILFSRENVQIKPILYSQ
jgi:broad specificity phosphatase PhoE